MSGQVKHDEHHQRFLMELGPYQAFLVYAKKGKVLDFYHIYVPDPFRNQGHSEKILIAAFEYAKENGYTVVASCPFIAQSFLPRFPQYQKSVQSGEFPFAS